MSHGDRDYRLITTNGPQAKGGGKMSAIAKLMDAWGLTEANTRDVLTKLDAKRWLGGDNLSAITHAGIIDNDSTADKMHGHTGFWFGIIADGEENIAFVTNGDPVWDTWCESVANDIGVIWGDASDELKEYKLD